jgi:hypothetical protein
MAVVTAVSGTGPALATQRIAPDYQICQVQSEAEFRTAIEGIVQRSLDKGLAGIDYHLLVAEQWRRGGIEQVIDRQIDEAISQVRAEESWTELLRSLGSSEKAQALATAVAERVYRSEAFKNALEQTSGEIGREIGKRMEIATTDTAEPAAQCMSAFLGPRYGSTIARIVSDDTRKEFELDAQGMSAGVGTGKVLLGGKEAIAGAIILITRRQLAKIAQRLGTRIVGSVLSRVVSVAAGGVGLVLIAKDIWDFRHGVLPIIASEMKSKASKDKVQTEIAGAIKEQIGEHTREIAAGSAERIVEIWKDFRRAHAKVLELADKHVAFKDFLESVKPAAMPRLDQMTALLLESEGVEGVLKRLADGSLNEIVSQWPEEAVDMARDLRRAAPVFKWMALAGGDLAKVARNDIHRKLGPDDITKAGLGRLLALDDRLAIGRLVSVPARERGPLMELETGALKQLARALDESQLASLGAYLTGLKKEAAERVMRAVIQNPQKMQSLGRGYVRDAVLRSADQSAAVDMVLRADSLLDLVTLPQDVQLVADGRVSPILMWEKHPIATLIAGFLGLVVLRWVWRILTWRPGGRRRRSATHGA